MKDPLIYFGVPVWGAEYVRVYLETALPSQLSPNNIPALSNKDRCQYNIYTTTADAETIRSSSAYARLSAMLPTVIHDIEAPICDPIDPVTFCNNHKCLSACHLDSMKRAAKVDAANILLNADIVLADGFVARALSILASGKRVIEVAGPRASKESIEAELQSKFRGSDPVAISVPSRQLASLWVKHLHRMELRHFWTGDPAESFHPSHIYWRVGKHSIMARCFHLVPMVFWPRRADIAFESTIDGDLVSRNCPDLGDTHVAVDSDELFCVELSGYERDIGSIGIRGDVWGLVSNMSGSFGTDRSFKLFSYPIRIIGADEEPQSWNNAMAESAQLARQIAWIRNILLPLRSLVRKLGIHSIAPSLERAMQSVKSLSAVQLLRRIGPVRKLVLLLRGALAPK